MIKIKRVYEKPERTDGKRILVDRLWPRGISKEAASLDLWMKDIAPSDALREWFGHDPKRWRAFKSKYLKEINGTEALKQLSQMAKGGNITLVYAAKDEQHNNAVALSEIIGKPKKEKTQRGSTSLQHRV